MTKLHFMKPGAASYTEGHAGLGLWPEASMIGPAGQSLGVNRDREVWTLQRTCLHSCICPGSSGLAWVEWAGQGGVS